MNVIMGGAEQVNGAGMNHKWRKGGRKEKMGNRGKGWASREDLMRKKGV